MKNDRYLQEKAERYRLMSALATRPEIKRQLRLWAHEFEVLAESIDTEDRPEPEKEEFVEVDEIAL